MISLDPIRPYLPLVYAGIFAVVIGLFWLQSRTITNLRERVKEKSAALQGYATAQQTNLETIGRLQTAQAALLQALQLERERAVAAATEAQRRVDMVNAELETTRRELANVYEHSETAREWGDRGVDRDVADLLPNGTHRPN